MSLPTKRHLTFYAKRVPSHLPLPRDSRLFYATSTLFLSRSVRLSTRVKFISPSPLLRGVDYPGSLRIFSNMFPLGRREGRVDLVSYRKSCAPRQRGKWDKICVESRTLLDREGGGERWDGLASREKLYSFSRLISLSLRTVIRLFMTGK